MVRQKAVLGRRAKPLGGGWAVDDLQSLLGVDVDVDGDLVVKGAHTNSYLAREIEQSRRLLYAA
jgi:hypothetical protein